MSGALSQIQRLQVQSELNLLSFEDISVLDTRFRWLQQARDEQLPPENYAVWLLLAGRGFGKTRTGAEDIWWPAALQEQRIAVIGPTRDDVRKTCYEGESGLLEVIPECMVADYNRTSLELWLRSGSYFVGYSSEEPERLRGPQHHRAWCDEVAAWKYPEDTWDMMEFGLRLGDAPSVVATTTPKPIKLVKDLMSDPDTVISTGSTFDNEKNLPPRFLSRLRRKYEGTRLGAQELYAKMLDDNPYALWQRSVIDETRRRTVGDLARVVVGVDPPVTSGEDSDECGIVVAGRDQEQDHAFVLDDQSCQGLSPEGWADRVVKAYHAFAADAVVAEVNQGGDMVESVIRQVDRNVNVIKVHATRGKVVRAEPVSAMYEQKRIHHCGTFGSLEDQMCEFSSDFDKKTMGYSPDRVDALVWAMTELMLGGEDFDWYVGS